MASTEPKPLTEEQAKQRDELNAQAARYEAAQTEKTRRERQESLATTQALADLLNADAIGDAFHAALNDPKLDFDTKARINSLKTTLDYQMGQINTVLYSVQQPAPASAPTA